MTLGQHQERFSEDYAKLIIFAVSLGYGVRLGDVFSKPECRAHKRQSQHYKKLAGDINLFYSGRYLAETKDHHELGDFWESLNKRNRWGGRYGDGNHYERMDNGWINR